MNERRYDLDWLRVLAILLLHLFHCAMPFVSEWDWHIKNKETSNLLLECNFFLSRWRMPILFLISGIGTIFVVNRLSVRQYISQRAKRLLVPLVFGMLIIVPPQVYYERIFKGEKYTSFFEFYPSIFTTGVYPEGNLSWHHLWFIAYLFVYSIIAVPVVLFLKSEKGKNLIAFTANTTQRYGMYGFACILFGASFLYFWFPNETHAFAGDWAGFTKYFLYFLFGCFIGTNPMFWKHMEDNRRRNLKIAFFSILLINYFRWNNVEPDWGMTGRNILFFALLTVSAWIWVITFLGYAKKYLNFNNKILQLANEAIYPFYILHQTIIVIIAYYIVQVNESIISKYLFLTIVSFGLSVGLYVFCVKPYNVIRVLFGMKIKS